MTHTDLVVKDAMTARQEGRMDEALRLLLQLWDQAVHGDVRAMAGEFMIMFEWTQLAEAYPPALDALAGARDEQVRRLLTGDENFSVSGRGSPRSRFDVIADINKTLKQPRATYELFMQLESELPEVARRTGSRALPAIVEAGNFALAERYISTPVELRDFSAHLNLLCGEFPLFPPISGGAPRLSAELSNFMTAVRLRATVLHGLGRELEAEQLRDEALAGLESEEMRALALRELDVPGTIIRKIVDHQMAPDAASLPDGPTSQSAQSGAGQWPY